MKALIIVDIQNDFTKGGSLEVQGGDEIITLINELQHHFDLLIATQDWHPQHHKSFASNHPRRNPFEKIQLNDLEQVLWPDHCVQCSTGAMFHKDLNLNNVEAIFRKGMDPNIDSYSGFYDNGHLKSTGLAGYLRERNVTEVYVCGLAGDYCVYFTAIDAIREGFKTFYIEDATRSINEDGFEKAKVTIETSGGRIVESSDILRESH